MMKVVERILAGILMTSLLIVLIISSVEIAVYSDYGYFEKEFKKYDVNNESGIVNMDMDELVGVTKEMMSYLRGNRDDLVIYAVIDGETKEFFNDREKSHMADVRDVFVAALHVRTGALLMSVISFVNLFLLMYWNDIKKLLFRAYLCAIGVLAAIVCALSIWAYIDFTGLFYKFHALFFSNYEWILDPDISRLVNIVPEGFFVDTAIRIVVIFILLIIIMGALLLFAKNINEKSRKIQLGGTYE